MEGTQQKLAGVLLEHIRSLGLISNSACGRAMDLVYTGADLPRFFREPEKEGGHECASDTP